MSAKKLAFRVVIGNFDLNQAIFFMVETISSSREAIVLEDQYELSFADRASAIYTKDMLIVDVPVNGQPTPRKVEPGVFTRSIPDMENPK